MLDKTDWVWGYEKLGDWFPMKVFLALVFIAAALATLHFVFAAYHKILTHPEIYSKGMRMLITHIGFLGL